jgi:leucyl aminopeptidase
LPINQFVNKWISEHAVTEYLVRAIVDQSYIINSLKTQNKSKLVNFQVYLHAIKLATKEMKLGLKHGLAIAEGVNLSKDLGNLPPNICTPNFLANTAKKLGRENKMRVTVLNQKQIEKLKMGSFLSVAKGSRQPLKFITLEHNKGPKNQKPIVMVGKGITFDAGGISIKPSSAMDEMKYDMCGAATVLGLMQTVGQLNLPLNIIGVIPACENLPDGQALKPGDIVTSMSGQTIEILNTDAEGRLILCDALTYAEKYKPEVVIDIATLTGACVIALGHHVSAVYSNNQPLADELRIAGEVALDQVWQMPLWDEYQPQLNRNFADMANIGGRAAGSITAACFLSRFAKKYNWAHLDIAGTAWKSGKEKGSTGRPVSLLSQFLIKRIMDKN